MKVFQIGFNKCGTRTIHRFFQENGFQSVHWDKGRLARTIFVNLQEQRPLLEGYGDFEVFCDMEHLTEDVHLEAYKLYPYFAEEWPAAIFILNTRNRDAWVKSRLNHGDGAIVRRQMRLYRVKSRDEVVQRWIEDWEHHHRRAVEFFEGKKHRFFMFDIDKGGPEDIQRHIPERKFNAAKYRARGVTAKSGASHDQSPADFSWL